MCIYIHTHTSLCCLTPTLRCAVEQGGTDGLRLQSALDHQLADLRGGADQIRVGVVWAQDQNAVHCDEDKEEESEKMFYEYS